MQSVMQATNTHIRAMACANNNANKRTTIHAVHDANMTASNAANIHTNKKQPYMQTQLRTNIQPTMQTNRHNCTTLYNQ